MMKFYTKFFTTVVLLLTLSFSTSVLAQQWEQIQELPAAQNIFVAKNGNLISSDFHFDYIGGIYYSQDGGLNWTKADVEDYAYNRMIQAGDYIIAAGEGCNLARSADNGITWEVLNYGYMYSEYLTEEAIQYNVCYAVIYYKNKLFLSDFGGGGVIYSEDFGETWTMTDRESLKYYIDGVAMTRAKDDGMAIDSFYNMAENNNELLLFGVYFVYRLNETDYTWELLRNDSNFMGVSTTVNNRLFCGRAIMNYNANTPFLEYTEDGGRTWGHVGHADTISYDTNVRAMHSDEKGMYVALQQGGFYYTTDLGETWMNISDGIPYNINNNDGSKMYYSPLIVDSDDEYIYTAIYDLPWAGTSVSGIYRYKKSDLPVASVDRTLNDIAVYISNSTIYTAEVADIAIYSINGTLVSNTTSAIEADLSSLARGVYIYQVTCNNATVTGKFIKR